MRGIVMWAVAAALGGCLAAPAPVDPAALLDAPASGLRLEDPVRVTGATTSEPAIAEAPDGTLFVAGIGSPPGKTAVTKLWRSADGGGTWELLVHGLEDGGIGTSDTDLAVAPDGTLYHIAMQWVPWGHLINVGASTDRGASWKWTVIGLGPFVDRPWVEVAPDGTAHAIWSSPRGTHHASSADRGATWREGPIVHPTGGSSGLAVGPAGELAVRIFPSRAPTMVAMPLFVDPEADGVAVSRDAGATWTWRELPGERDWGEGFGGDGTPRWVDPVAFDEAGTLYAAWGEGDTLFLARSGDLGEAWDVVPLGRREGTVAFFPFLRGGAKGELAATWFTVRAETATGDWEGTTAHLAHVLGADGPAPDVREATVDRDGLGSGGEYFQAVLLHEGGVAAAIPHADEEETRRGFDFLRAR